MSGPVFGGGRSVERPREQLPALSTASITQQILASQTAQLIALNNELSNLQLLKDITTIKLVLKWFEVLGEGEIARTIAGFLISKAERFTINVPKIISSTRHQYSQRNQLSEPNLTILNQFNVDAMQAQTNEIAVNAYNKFTKRAHDSTEKVATTLVAFNKFLKVNKVEIANLNAANASGVTALAEQDPQLDTVIIKRLGLIALSAKTS